MISPDGSTGPSCTVTMPMSSFAPITIGLKPSTDSSCSCHERSIAASAPVGAKAIKLVFGNDRKQRQIDRINAFAEHGALPATLAELRLRRMIAAEKCLRILEVVAADDPAQRLAGASASPSRA